MRLTFGRALPATALIIGVWLLGPALAQKADGQPAAVLDLPGQVVPHAQANLHALVTGVVQVVPVDIGDVVKKDQILARLAVPDLEHEVEQKKARQALAEVGIEQARRNVEIVEAGLMLLEGRGQEAKAGVARAKAEHEFAKVKHERLKRLADNKAVSAAEVEEAVQQLQAAQARLHEAEAKVKLAEFGRAEALAKRDKAVTDVKAAEVGLLVARADTRRAEAMLRAAEIRAPFDGVIIRRNATVGEAVGPSGPKQTPLFTLARLDPVRIVFHIPEKHLRSVAVGTPVKVLFVQPDKHVVEAKVSRIGVELDSKGKERTLRTEVELANPQQALRPGSSVTVVIRTEKE